MKKLALALGLLAAAPLAASADVTKDDIRKLAAAGVGDEVILAFIRSNGPVARLSADDIVELKQAGAGEKVLSALVGGSSAPQKVQTQIVEKVVERPVYVPSSTTYVVDTPSYYYPSYYYSNYAWPGYYSSYYSNCSPRYSYSSYCGPRFGVSYYGGSSRCSPRSTWGVSIRR
ncbi:MAG TPA: hypothetical protein VJB14_06505 [Planctomycetota bacterium]|nr:hypothetical protein [Planctomycetota bacterium]